MEQMHMVYNCSDSEESSGIPKHTSVNYNCTAIASVHKSDHN